MNHLQFAIAFLVAGTVLSACGREKPYDYAFTKSTNHNGIDRYQFHGPRAPALDSPYETADFTKLNGILKHVGLGPIPPGKPFNPAGKTQFVMNDYPAGKLTFSMRKCDYDKGDDAYMCISDITVAPSEDEQMRYSAGNSPNKRYVTRAQYGENWPFTVDSGVISCRNAGEVYFRTTDYRTFAVNGLAIASDRGFGPGIHEIWRDDRRNPGLNIKVSVMPIINDGLKLCQP